jgi:hypothetical protein
MKKILLMLLFCSLPVFAEAATYWIHPTDNSALGTRRDARARPIPDRGNTVPSVRQIHIYRQGIPFLSFMTTSPER